MWLEEKNDLCWLRALPAVFRSWRSESGEDGSSTIVASRVVELEHSIKNKGVQAEGKFTIQMNADGQQAVVNMDKFSLTEDMADDFKELLRTGILQTAHAVKWGQEPFVRHPCLRAVYKVGVQEDLSLFVSADDNLAFATTLL